MAPLTDHEEVPAVETRIIVRIELTPGARDRLNECQKKSGMTQVSMLSRVVEWFAKQPEGMRWLLLGSVPENSPTGRSAYAAEGSAKKRSRTEV